MKIGLIARSITDSLLRLAAQTAACCKNACIEDEPENNRHCGEDCHAQPG